MLNEPPAIGRLPDDAQERRRFRRSTVFVILLSFPLLLSVDLYYISTGLDTVINAWKILSAVVVTLMFLNQTISGKAKLRHLVPMIAVMAVLAFSTFMNDGSFQRYAITWGGFFVVCLLVELTIRDKTVELLLALKIVLGAIIIGNFLTVVGAPGGLWSIGDEGFWLLGHRNNFGTPSIAAIVISAAYDFLVRSRLTMSTVVIGAAALGAVALTWSASSVVTVVLVFAVILIAAFGRHGLRLIRPFMLLIIYAAIDIGIVHFRIQDHFSEFIVEVLDRSTSLTGRTKIWEIVEGMFQQSPIYGYGIQLTENNGLTIYNKAYVHAHNGELDILLNGGILTLVPHVILIVMMASIAAKNYQSRTVQILYIGLIIVMFRAITGLFFSAYALLLVYLILNAKVIAERSVGVELRLADKFDR